MGVFRNCIFKNKPAFLLMECLFCLLIMMLCVTICYQYMSRSNTFYQQTQKYMKAATLARSIIDYFFIYGNLPTQEENSPFIVKFKKIRQLGKSRGGRAFALIQLQISWNYASFLNIHDKKVVRYLFGAFIYE